MDRWEQPRRSQPAQVNNTAKVVPQSAGSRVVATTHGGGEKAFGDLGVGSGDVVVKRDAEGLCGVDAVRRIRDRGDTIFAQPPAATLGQCILKNVRWWKRITMTNDTVNRPRANDPGYSQKKRQQCLLQPVSPGENGKELDLSWAAQQPVGAEGGASSQPQRARSHQSDPPRRTVCSRIPNLDVQL